MIITTGRIRRINYRDQSTSHGCSSKRRLAEIPRPKSRPFFCDSVTPDRIKSKIAESNSKSYSSSKHISCSCTRAPEESVQHQIQEVSSSYTPRQRHQDRGRIEFNCVNTSPKLPRSCGTSVLLKPCHVLHAKTIKQEFCCAHTESHVQNSQVLLSCWRQPILGSSKVFTPCTQHVYMSTTTSTFACSGSASTTPCATTTRLRPHALYVSLAVRREYSSPSHSGSTSTSPCAVTTRPRLHAHYVDLTVRHGY
jgi:hypothetical protein